MNEVQTSDVTELVEEPTLVEEQKMDITTERLMQPQRLENESFDEYKERRLVANYKAKMLSKGRLVWDSKKQGTYQAKDDPVAKQLAEVM